MRQSLLPRGVGLAHALLLSALCALLSASSRAAPSSSDTRLPSTLAPPEETAPPGETVPSTLVGAEEVALPTLSMQEQAFLRDVTALTRAPHRLAGSAEGARAGAYIKQRLGEAGVREIYPLSMPVWQSHRERCELNVAGRSLVLSPLRPNVVVNPTTPAAGVTGPLFYVGEGGLDDYGDRQVDGGIVVMRYASFENYKRAFALGARAVVFLGTGEETPVEPKVAPVPSNELRYYASSEDAGPLFSRDQARARIDCKVGWRLGTATSYVARIPGTDPDFASGRDEAEAMVLSVGYDSFGAVPELSGGARKAANVAALLEAARRFAQHPPKRDLLLVFFDAQARGLQGARELYASLAMSQEEAERLRRQLAGERQHLGALRKDLQAHGLGLTQVSDEQRVWLQLLLSEEAEFARDDINRELSSFRLTSRDREHPRVVALERDGMRWDKTRRALHEGTFDAHVAEQRLLARKGTPDALRQVGLFGVLLERTLGRLQARLSELDREWHMAEQRLALRRGTGRSQESPTWITLHVSYDFGDQAATWGVVVGDWSYQLFPLSTPKPESDTPGYYGRVLKAIDDARMGTSLPSLDVRTLAEPTLGLTFASRPFVSGGSVAGSYGYYNVSLMTGHDGRVRDGHPADTLEHLQWQILRRQALEGSELMALLANADGLSLPGVFKGLAVSEYPSFEQGRSSGNYAGLVVSGSLSEDRPASGAMMAIWPGKKGNERSAWTSLVEAQRVADYDPILLEPVNQHGRFRLVGLREDIHEEVMTIGALFDEQGALRAITNTDQQAQKIQESMRVNLFTGRGGHFTTLPTLEAKPEQFKLLKAGLDAEFRRMRSLWGEQDGHGFFYVSDQVVDYRIRLFQPLGPVALGPFADRKSPQQGLAPEQFAQGIWLSPHTATDLWNLNESRLATLRERGVTSADLEILHARAQRARHAGEKSQGALEREAAYAQSAALSHRVYAPLRSAMDDLVYAIVLLLLLSIPFAFAMERLLIGATSVYGRIGGFTLIFLVNFGLLYWLHPGFAIASTPMIIFLAFAIVLLSSMVISIVVRKFKTELRAMQWQGTGNHELEVSRAGTLLAAVAMGMSTMRRRPTRTLLTAVTVVMLTFTILSFASFSRTVGVRSVYAGPVSESTGPDLLVRKLDYSALPPGLFDMLRGREGKGGALVPNYWLVREESEEPRTAVARPDTGASVTVDGVMGISEADLKRWPELRRALGHGGADALPADGVLLPAVVQDVLKLTPGDPLLLAGQRVRFLGALNGPELQRLRHLDGQSVLPVDFQDAAAQASGGNAQNAEQTDALNVTAAERDFVHLSSDQVALASNQLVRSLGGKPHSVSVHVGEGVDVVELGKRISEMLAMPTWAAGSSGVERLVMTVLTEVSGGLSLFIPLLLGGLIIFGTLLSSISDREKEIYTFSALGLSPGHVGVLFFAEAAVYAVVGGMGGHLVAQFVALGAAQLAEAGLLGPTSINYSSTNSLFAIGVVMLTVIVSAIYPALRASRTANPGLSRSWKLPVAEGDRIDLKFPFTVSAYDVTGIVSFLSEHLERHNDAGLGAFAASNVNVKRRADGNLCVSADLALSPFDLGVTQHMTLNAEPSEIPGVDEVRIVVERKSGARGDWHRQNGVFVRDLRRQFLLWRTLQADIIEVYRLRTLEHLGEPSSSDVALSVPQGKSPVDNAEHGGAR